MSTKNVSFGSNTVSPRTDTAIDACVSPAGIVRSPLVAV
jgi:hypothetical protein